MSVNFQVPCMCVNCTGGFQFEVHGCWRSPQRTGGALKAGTPASHCPAESQVPNPNQMPPGTEPPCPPAPHGPTSLRTSCDIFPAFCVCDSPSPETLSTFCEMDPNARPSSQNRKALFESSHWRDRPWTQVKRPSKQWCSSSVRMASSRPTPLTTCGTTPASRDTWCP